MMKWTVIKSAAEYEKALGRIEELMEAKAGSVQADELELLALLVEDYEEKRFPVSQPDPVTAIRFRMEQMELTPRDLVPLWAVAAGYLKFFLGNGA